MGSETGPVGHNSAIATTAESAGTAVEPAPAKLNLSLRIVGRREDGYHLLDGLIAFAALGDRVTARVAAPGSGVSLTIRGPFAPALTGEMDNLVALATRTLASALDRPADVALHLDKTLPVASGIGGGSADAAATLRALARLWDRPADDPILYNVAAGLGADVPVCLARHTSWVSGIGEVLERGPDLSGIPIVLINPGVAVPTPPVFKAWKASRRPFSMADRPSIPDRPAPADLADALAATANDLTEPASSLVPEIPASLAALAAAGACRLARMSGSGATVFGVFDSADEAAAAADTLAVANPEWWIRATALI